MAGDDGSGKISGMCVYICLKRMTVMSALEDASYHVCNMCVFSRVQKEFLGLIHKRWVLQRISFGGLSDIKVFLVMRQSIEDVVCFGYKMSN